MKITYENSPYHYILINHLAQLYHIPLFPLWDIIVLSCYCRGCVEFWSKFNDPPTPTPPGFHVHILIRTLIQTQKRVPWASSFLGAYPQLEVVVSVSSINGSSGTFHTVRSNTTTSGGHTMGLPYNHLYPDDLQAKDVRPKMVMPLEYLPRCSIPISLDGISITNWKLVINSKCLGYIHNL